MRGPTHGAIVAGVSSTLIAGYIREQTRDGYKPNVNPPSVSERVRNRAPLALAGLGFTGLSTAVAYKFDSLERRILGDPTADIPIQRQGGHRDLHSLPYLGTIWGAAHLVLHSTANFGEWIASKLHVPERAGEFADHLNNLAEWIVSGSCFGVFGHIIGDVPTSGRGATALQLLSPITDRNFAIGVIKSTSPVYNQLLKEAGLVLAGAAWSVSGAYLLSWKPPETRVYDYANKLRECENFSGAMGIVLEDLDRIFESLTPEPAEQFWNRPLFDSPYENIHSAIDHHWFHQYIDFEQVFNTETVDPKVLVDRGIWPQNLFPVDGTPLKSEGNSEGLPLTGQRMVDTSRLTTTDLTSETSDSPSLFDSESTPNEGNSLRGASPPSAEDSLVSGSDSASRDPSLQEEASSASGETPLQDSTEDESRGLPIKETNESETDGTEE